MSGDSMAGLMVDESADTMVVWMVLQMAVTMEMKQAVKTVEKLEDWKAELSVNP